MGIQIIHSNYDTNSTKVSIVHIGLGAFVRAHLAVYTEKALNQGDKDWGICAANIRSNKKIVDILNQQNRRYTVVEKSSSSDITLREVSAIKEVMFAGNGETQPLIKRLQDPEIKIVSLTITEKGYFYDPTTKQLKLNDPAIVYDLKNPEAPKTAIGILAAALKKRYYTGTTAFTILSCDNMPENGKSTKESVIQYCRQLDNALALWVESSVSFPSTMVDRIVPAATEQSLNEANCLISQHSKGPTDNTAVTCESFTQWVIEDDFPLGRPAWENCGATIITNVVPFEEMKLRLLNGSHSLLAYLGTLAGLNTVYDCMQQANFVALIRQYMTQEAMPTLAMPEGENIEAYIDSLLQRFANDSLQHKTIQIAMDGSQKIPQRWLAGAMTLLEKNALPKITALGIAAWFRYLNGVDDKERAIEINDPMAAELKTIHKTHTNVDDKINALLHTQPFSQLNLNANTHFVNTITTYYKELETLGTDKTIARILNKALTPSHVIVKNIQDSI